MKFIKPYTEKLLKDLDNPDLWEDSRFCVRHKEEKFEVRDSAFADNLIWGRCEIKFNLLEKFLVTKKVSKLKKMFESNLETTPKYFKV